jgi:serine/threonine protein kinase
VEFRRKDHALERSKLLKGRYSLSRLVNRTSQSEVWIAYDRDGGQALLKTWPYQGNKPNDVVRALWDRELRNLFRLSSSPEAESRLVVLRDAGIDAEHKCFVMLLAAPGFENLRQVLDARTRHDWLRDLRATESRLLLWRAMRNLALGLTQLHDQQMLHRALTSDAIYLDAAVGPETLRLGGFEWTVRVGQPALGQSSSDLPTAPEQFAGSALAQTFESDWYQFGTVLAQIFSGVSQDIAVDPSRHDDLTARVSDNQKITGVERDLLISPAGALTRATTQQRRSGRC